MQYIQRANDKDNFVEKIISRVGYPRWDKSVIRKGNLVNGRGATDSTDITYIPFVRDSQNYVNATLGIFTSPSDTMLKFIATGSTINRSMYLILLPKNLLCFS